MIKLITRLLHIRLLRHALAIVAMQLLALFRSSQLLFPFMLYLFMIFFLVLIVQDKALEHNFIVLVEQLAGAGSLDDGNQVQIFAALYAKLSFGLYLVSAVLRKVTGGRFEWTLRQQWCSMAAISCGWLVFGIIAAITGVAKDNETLWWLLIGFLFTIVTIVVGSYALCISLMTDAISMYIRQTVQEADEREKQNADSP